MAESTIRCSAREHPGPGEVQATDKEGRAVTISRRVTQHSSQAAHLPKG